MKQRMSTKGKSVILNEVKDLQDSSAFGLRMTVLSFVFVLIANGLAFSATSIAERFSEANQLYRDAKYSEAAKTYEEVAKQKPAAEVYYNLGNAYFKEKKIGLAVLNYERARALSPRNADILENLAFANRFVEYKIEDKRNWYLRKKSQLLNSVTFSECWLLALVAYFIFVSGFFVFLLRGRQLAFGRSGAIAIALVIFCSFPLLLKYGELGAGRRGIVTGNQVEVRFGPALGDQIAFRLVEGLEVFINDTKDDWCRIQLRDGRSGWVSKLQVDLV